ncbi:multicopper oxidase family protein [Streptomyces sp. NPDC002788]
MPGPTIEVRRGEKLHVTWANDLSGPLPVTVVEVPATTTPPALWDQPGRSGYAARDDVAQLRPWTVVHLHGAVTGSGNDGWPENGVGPGMSQLSEYVNDQPATALFCHDHAMNITRWNVMAGLSGLYLIRDEQEDALGPPSSPYEVPLFIADRNLDTDAEGRLTGRLLHKTAVVHREPMLQMRAFTGPFTQVNGVIWPYLHVAPRWYRFRVVNAANTRQYRLTLTDEDGQPIPAGTVRQIGTDHGLLPEPVPLEDNSLTLCSAERAELLVEFSAFAGKRLRLVNTNANPDPGPWPQVMEFRVDARPAHDPFVLPLRLSTGAPAPQSAALDRPGQDRLVVLTTRAPDRQRVRHDRLRGHRAGADRGRQRPGEHRAAAGHRPGHRLAALGLRASGPLASLLGLDGPTAAYAVAFGLLAVLPLACVAEALRLPRDAGAVVTGPASERVGRPAARTAR